MVETLDCWTCGLLELVIAVSVCVVFWEGWSFGIMDGVLCVYYGVWVVWICCVLVFLIVGWED